MIYIRTPADSSLRVKQDFMVDTIDGGRCSIIRNNRLHLLSFLIMFEKTPVRAVSIESTFLYVDEFGCINLLLSR